MWRSKEKIPSHILTQMRQNSNHFISFQEIKRIIPFTKIPVGGMDQGQT
jgi:hypothetical protein